MEVTVMTGHQLLYRRNKELASVYVKPQRGQTLRRYGRFPISGEKLKRENRLLQDAPVWAPVEERMRLLFCQI